MRKRLRVIFIAICAVSLSSAISSASGTAANDQVVLSPAGRVASSPDIAVGPDGSINLIWVDKGEARPAESHPGQAAQPRGPQSGGHTHKTYNDLYFARSTDGGKSFTAPMRINSAGGEVWGFATSRPRIAVGKSGIIHIFYHGNRFDRSAPRQAVDARYTRSTDGGKTFEKTRTLNAYAAGRDDGELSEAHCFGTMSVAPNGDVHAYWIDTRHMKSDKDNGAVYGIASRDEGKTFEKERLVFQNEACPCCQLNLAFSPDSKIYLTLRSVFPDGSRDSTVARSDDGGKTFLPRARVSDKSWTIDGCPLKPLNLSVDRKGRIYAAWYAGEMQPAGVYFSISEDKSKTFAKPQQLHPDAKLSDHAQVAVTDDGIVRVVWDARVGETKRIYLRTSNDTGKTFGPVTELPMPAGNADYPVIGSFRNKTFVAWQLNGQIRFQVLPEMIAQIEPVNAEQFRHHLARNRGSVVLVNLWATWCVPCLKELPELEQLQQQYRERGLKIITVSTDDPAEIGKARKFLFERAPGLTGYLQTETEQEKFVGVIDPSWAEIMPTTFVLDREGNLKVKLSGSKSREEFEKVVVPLLDGK